MSDPGGDDATAVPRDRVFRALRAKTPAVPQGLQYVLIRALSAMGHGLTLRTSYDLVAQALMDADAAQPGQAQEPAHAQSPSPQAATDAATALKGNKDALIKELMNWSCDRGPDDPGDAHLMKALWSYQGDRTTPCDECDGECGEPCAPCTVVQAHAMLDHFITTWNRRNGITPPEPAADRPGTTARGNDHG
jgi:hypothetical protein